MALKELERATRPLCIYHGGCADGFTAAWAVWKRFGDEFDYFPGVYQNPPPDVKGRDVLLVDFSYKRDVLKQMARSARSILVLDHHKSAAEDLWASFSTGDEAPHVQSFGPDSSLTWEAHMMNATSDAGHGLDYCEIYTLFDMNRSGAGIAWDFFHPGELRPNLVSYVEDRDLWRFKLEHSRQVNAYVFAHQYQFDIWDKLNDEMSNARGVYRANDDKDYDMQESLRYHFEEHSCPTNWLRECTAVIEAGDADPHGFLEFVRAVEVPRSFGDDADWFSIFPETQPEPDFQSPIAEGHRMREFQNQPCPVHGVSCRKIGGGTAIGLDIEASNLFACGTETHWQTGDDPKGRIVRRA